MTYTLPEPNNPAVKSARSNIMRSALSRANKTLSDSTLGTDPNWRKVDNTPNNPNWREA